MYDNVLAVIPCRRGSKRFPGKNLALFQGVPLVTNTIRIAKAAGIEKILVTSDSEDVLKIAKFEKVNFQRRDEHLCTDDATTEDVVEDAVHYAAGGEIDTICLLQVTSPLLRPDGLQNALDIYIETELTSLTAVNLLYEPVGAFYIVDPELFMKNKSRYQEGGGLYMLPAEQCVDVDYQHQLQIANIIAAGGV
jgi:CMP-N-acetylneuraminic acid synthetase